MARRNIAYPPEVKGHPLPMKAWESANWKNSNFIIFINGLPGVGKSTLAAYLQFILDRGTNHEFRCELKNWCLTQKTFIRALNADTQVARVLVWEEPYSAGIKDGGANARDFQKYANKQISTIFQTMRKNNNIVILTLPATSSFDKQARNVAHCMIHVKQNNGVYGTARVYMRDFNPIFDTVMHPFMRVRKNGRMVRMKNLYFGLPPKSWFDACTQKSDDYKDFWRREIEKYKDESKTKSTATRRLNFLVAFRNDPEAFKRTVKGEIKWDYQKISREFGATYSTATQWCKELVI